MKPLITTAIMAGLAGPALAGNLETPITEQPIYLPAVPLNGAWNGAYVGAGLGAHDGMGRADVFAGYRTYLGNRWILGGEVGAHCVDENSRITDWVEQVSSVVGTGKFTPGETTTTTVWGEGRDFTETDTINVHGTDYPVGQSGGSTAFIADGSLYVIDGTVSSKEIAHLIKTGKIKQWVKNGDAVMLEQTTTTTTEPGTEITEVRQSQIIHTRANKWCGYSAEGQIGYDMNSVLPYIHAGWADEDFKGSGWQAGAGIDWKASPQSKWVFGAKVTQQFFVDDATVFTIRAAYQF